MPTKFELERDAQRLARHQRVSEQIKETDKGMSRETSRTLLLYTGDIVPDPDQPRRFYDEDAAALQELAASIRAVGVLSPIQVRPYPGVPDKYMIIVGERRWRACQIAGVNRIEAVVREEWDPFQIRAAQYEENEKRQDVSDIARARSLAAMRQSETGSRKRGWEEIAGRLGMQRNHAMRLVGLLQLPDGAVSLIDRRLLPGTHGAELVRLLKRVPDEDIVVLAESCAAPVPGGKARCPVKELARTVTDRLQAVHEQQAVHGQQTVVTDENHERTSSNNVGGQSTETLWEVAQLLVPGNLEQAASQNAEGEFGYPRSFVQELVHAWTSNLLTASEQHLIREAWKSHPLLDNDKLEDDEKDKSDAGNRNENPSARKARPEKAADLHTENT
ncbi:MAG: ParB/RepB/Spo0J family partition protein [Janthinobacterium lividum]